MVYFHTKNPNLGIFWRAKEWNLLVYFLIIWYSLWSFGIFSPFLVCLDQEKSGNPGKKLFCLSLGIICSK
jgi:hypothetical protein